MNTEYLISKIVTILLKIPGLIFIFSFKGFFQAYIANKLGDSTAKNTGKLTLSPLAHIDPIGFLFILFLGFGWGKPIPVRTRNFKKTKRDIAIFYASGPLSCIFAGFILTFLYLLSTKMQFGNIAEYIQLMFLYATQISIVLGILYCMPIPGFDGYNFITNFVPYKYYRQLYNIERYSNFIAMGFILLLFTTDVGHFLIDIPTFKLFYLFIHLWKLLPFI